MEKYAWKAIIKDGMQQEYIKRHNSIWPELVQLLKEAGICNYSIWMSGNEVFGYYECEKGIDFAVKTQNESPLVAKWNEYMKDVMVMDFDEEKESQPRIDQVFNLI